MSQVGVVLCPGCQARLRVPAGWLQDAIRCKHCRTPFRVKVPGRSWRGSLVGVCVLGVVALGIGFVGPRLSHLVAKPAPPPATSPVKEVWPEDQRVPLPVPAVDRKAPVRAKAKARTTEQRKAEKPRPVAKKPAAPLAKPAGKLDAAALARFIDQALQHQLDSEGVPASPRAHDAEFLRRVYLDITGVIPPPEKVAAFLDSKDPAKRAKVIDELLASPLYGKHLADIWSDLMLPRNSDNRRLQPQPLVRWLEESFNANKPWDRMVREVLTATGTQDKNGAVTYFIANPTADKMTDSVTRLFLGVQLQCAQCHNHPFTDWKQDEYWAMAAFFTKVQMNGTVKKAAKRGGQLAVSEQPLRRGKGRGKKQKLPPSAKVVPAKFLMGERPQLNKDAPYRPVVAAWMTAPQNRFFARAMVNRTWAHYFGRGFVNPVDDMHDKNTPSHPVLLEVMAEQFAANGFDVKALVRALCNSQAYQRTSKPLPGNEADEILFSHMAIKVLSPEQLYDSLVAVSGRDGQKAPGRGRKQKAAGKRGGPRNARDQFIVFFRTDEGADPTEYQAGIPQALRLINSPQFNTGAALLKKVLDQPGRTPEQVLEQLYLATVSRRPTAAEVQKLTAYVKGQDGAARKAYGDVLWALLNSSEFTLNH